MGTTGSLEYDFSAG